MGPRPSSTPASAATSSKSISAATTRHARSRARVLPGITTQLHALRGIDERYVILEGEGRVEVDGGAPESVKPLDVVAIPAGKSQRITNSGKSDLVFLCVCTPRFRQEAYVEVRE